jgi:hypothetical protein
VQSPTATSLAVKYATYLTFGVNPPPPPPAPEMRSVTFVVAVAAVTVAVPDVVAQVAFESTP